MAQLLANSCLVFFFVHADGGTRDAQESRGLGDVYKRPLLFRFSLPLLFRFSLPLLFRFSSASLPLLSSASLFRLSLPFLLSLIPIFRSRRRVE